MSSPPKKAKSDVVTPRSRPLRKSVRVDRGDGGPPSNFKRWENCATQERSKCSTAILILDTLGMHVRPVGVYVGNVVLLRLWWDEGDSRHSVAQFARRSRDS
jgi:hypothetical protein